jgi:Fe-S-cluster containining protein
MKAQPIAVPGHAPPPVDDVLTAITVLRAALESLPGTENPEYYPALQRVAASLVPPLHAAYDAYVAAVLITDDKKITCSKACSACCRHFVSSVEPFELIALDQHARSRENYSDVIVSSHNRTMAYEKVLREDSRHSAAEDAEDRALYHYFLRGLPCPYLEADGTCGVYEWRPMACRMFFAESAPRYCAGKALASPWNRNFQVELPQEAEEVLARCSRLLEHLDLPDGLFPGMVMVNELFGRFGDVADPQAGQA